MQFIFQNNKCNFVFQNAQFINLCNSSDSIRSSKFLPHTVADEELILRVDITAEQFPSYSLVLNYLQHMVCLDEFFITLDHVVKTR